MIKHNLKYVKEFIEKENYQLLSDSYENCNEKLLVKCPIGHEHKIRFRNFKSGVRCPECKKINLQHNFSLNFLTVKSFIESQGYQLLSDNYKNNHTKLLLKCPIGHEYKAKFNKFQQGRRCPLCFGTIKKSYNYVKSFIESQGYQLLSNNYKNNHTKLLLKCPIGHEYKVTFSHFQRGQRCPFCVFEQQSSKGEQELQNFIKSLGISIIKNDRNTIINPLTNQYLELDVFMPSLNKAIEYNGDYWHSNDYQMVKDKIKINECERLGIDLLIVKDRDWINNQETEKQKIKRFIN